ncbi:MAG TPA: hypothetical protein VGZ26_02925, partial [Pirellulales bacterium]|nr:hypothetical protein [Pirellulales bacterium]
MSMMIPATVRAAIEEVFGPRHFFVAKPNRLRVEHVAFQRLPWEIFRGNLLDPSHTRETAEFEAWNLFLDTGDEPGGAPLISIKWQPARQQLFIVRQILSHGFEAYEDPPGVILSRPVQKWLAELAGTIEIEHFDSDTLRAELAGHVFRAVIGSSRLPITSIESPLPAFSLGQLAYLSNRSDSCEAQSDPLAFLRSALVQNCKTIEQVKALEVALRAIENREVPRLADVLMTSIGHDSETPDRIAK